MSISRELLKMVPVGEENGRSGLLLWRQLGMWSVTSIKHSLNAMAAEGLIERKGDLQWGQQISLYYRSRI